MISLIILLIGIVFTNVLNIYLFWGQIAVWKVLLYFLFAFVIIIAVNAFFATFCCKWLPDSWFNKDSKFYSPSKKECKFYEKLGIKTWKDRTFEFGILNGFRKNKVLEPNNPSYINQFIIECNKGYLTHLISMFAGAIVFLTVPIKLMLPMALPIFLTGFILNLIPTMILRYNVPRLKTLLKYTERKINPEAKTTLSNMEDENFLVQKNG